MRKKKTATRVRPRRARTLDGKGHDKIGSSVRVTTGMVSGARWRSRMRQELLSAKVRTVASVETIGIRDMSAKGRKSGVVLLTPPAALGYNAAHQAAWWLRKKLKTVAPPPALITDATGRPIARVEFDPVTFKRTRVPL